MFETLNTAGYDLYQLPNHPDLWCFDSKTSEEYSGNLLQVVKYMLASGFKIDYIEEGINLLADNVGRGDDAIHFGAFRSAMFTFKKEVSYGKRAS